MHGPSLGPNELECTGWGTGICSPFRKFLFGNGQASLEVIPVKHQEYIFGDDF